MGESLEFNDVLQEIRGSMHKGRLKLQSNEFVFKDNKTGKVDHFESSDIDKIHWLMRARGHCLKFIMKTGSTQRFDGFRETDFEKLSEFVQSNYDSELEKKDLSVKGWNWGIANFVGNTLDFKVDGLTAFEIPLSNISHSQTSKNEVTIEFHQNDEVPVSLMEMRFHIPSSSATSDVDPVAEFYTSVMAKADVIQATGDAITTFTEVQCLTPRGRYDLKIYPSFLQLHGKTFDYKIPYNTVLRLFLLPHRDNRQMFFVVSLDPPIKQGQTRYHFLILLFYKEAETTLELALSEEDLEQKYEGKLSKEMSGPEYEIISRIMKCLVNKKITVPGSFIGHSGTHSIACSYKAATGSLYPLERGFIFVHKPPVHIRFDEITSVNFARSAGNTRSFDFDIETLSSTTYNFVGIEKDEYSKLYDFVIQKKLRVKNIGGKDSHGAKSYNDDMMGSDDDDDDRDPYMERMKKEGKERQEEDGMQYDDDDDEEEDEDFKPEESASEPDDEYDSNPESTPESSSESGGDSDGGKAKKKKLQKKQKKEASRGSGEEEEEEEDDDEKPKKQKSKPKKESKSKKTKDSDAPKRPQTAYFLWLSENRADLKEEFPGISVTELTKKAGERWRELTDKTKWEKKAAEEKREYDSAMAEYKKRPSKREGSASPDGKKKSSSTKKPTGAFKSKDTISDEESSEEDTRAVSEEDEDEDDKPLKKKHKSEKKSSGIKTRKSRKEGSGSESEVGELPDDEEILSSPEHSAPEESEAESDE